MTEHQPRPDLSPRPKPARRLPAGDLRREERLKAALKANIARRKAQAQARADEAATDANPED